MVASAAKGLVAILACVHCSLTFFVALGAVVVGGAGVPLILGVRADMLLVPLAGAALFLGWLGWGWRAAAREAACEVPGAAAHDR